MSVIQIDHVREQRKQQAAEQNIQRMAKALLSAYPIADEKSIFDVESGASPTEALVQFIKQSLEMPDDALANLVLPALCDKLQARLNQFYQFQVGESR